MIALLYDMHCHLDFASQSDRIAHDAEAAKITALSCTVVPSSYVADLEKFAGCETIFLALGMHPWWIADERVGEADVARFETLIEDAPFAGEIGLDLAGDRGRTRERQIEVLMRLFDAIHAAGDGRVITFHVVRGASLLMELADMTDVFGRNTCSFHWFHGSTEELGRAISKGAFFSVGMRMLSTSAGEKLACAIPDERLLLETDSPAHEGSDWSIEIWEEEIRGTIARLAQVRGVSVQEIQEQVANNSEQLLAHVTPHP